MSYCSLARPLFSRFASSSVDYSHAIIGGGVVGLAIANELTKVTGNKVIVLEKNAKIGMETSSRNSEVIHAGLYYPVDSLKTKFCIEGNHIIYNELNPRKTGVDWLKCGKWVVAQTDFEDAYVERMYYKAKYELNIPVEILPSHKTQWMEPAVLVERSALVSPSTGIVDSHSFMEYLASSIEGQGGEIVIGSEVKDIQYLGGKYAIQCQETVNNTGEEVEIQVENVVNASGLYADKIANMILPTERHVKQYYAKGNYFTLKSQTPVVRKLIYPVPPRNGKSLGTHLTIDLNGQIKFGPDLEYVDSADNLTPNSGNIEEALEAIRRYYPHLQPGDLEASYCGIRPKLAAPGDSEFKDFYIKEEEGFPGFVNLLGIESPGLTSSIPIGRYVKGIFHG
ncbi:unnamed protein product [Kluyveromyces dobzhanskii CBS 2104]|uniref:L-2-hydroxyglutarate dehydrogenase, mitochondrial n=1 Tax=Kluyveromyces dobzhanskii CBS 2104 TaxID=1427455 RepID=A0A0A8L9B9_9SACH|nr:unnamed protein product [Kluyveromyces dobzhanskii CBS 2104]